MREIHIPSEGRQLAGILHTSTDVNAASVVLIISHGFRGSKEGGGRAIRMAEKAAGAGLHVIRFDFTALQTLTRQVAELGHVIDYARKNIGDRIILLGRSMGGSASLAYTDSDKNLAGLCLWATPWGLQDTFRLALGEYYRQLEQGKTIYIHDEYGPAVITPEFIEDFQNYDLLASAQRLSGMPLLQVHGSCDAVVPIQQAWDIHHAASGVSKKMVIIDKGDHHLAEHTEIASDAVINWLSTVI